MLIAAAVLAGCGSSKRASGPSSGRIDPAFIARVNATCAQALIGSKAFPYPNFDPTHPDVKLLPKVGAFFARRRAAGDAVPSQLQALGPPKSGQAIWAQMLRLAVKERALADSQINAALEGSPSGFVATLRPIAQLNQQLNQLSRQANFPTTSPCREIF